MAKLLVPYRKPSDEARFRKLAGMFHKPRTKES